MGKEGFKDLVVWQRAKDLAVRIYRVSEEGALGRNFGLRDQIRRCAVSVPSNLAEGDERDTDKESIRSFYFAKGSLAQLRTHMQVAFEIGYSEQNVFRGLDEECKHLGKMIGALIRTRKQHD